MHRFRHRANTATPIASIPDAVRQQRVMAEHSSDDSDARQRKKKEFILAYMRLKHTLSEIGLANIMAVLFVTLVAALADRVLCNWTSWKNIDSFPPPLPPPLFSP